MSLLIDAKAAGDILGIPHTWVLKEARHDRIPHIRLGRYVRFEADELLAWATKRRRGPSYRQATGGPVTPGSENGFGSVSALPNPSHRRGGRA